MLKNKRIVIIGGSSGIGFAIARLACEEGAKVTIASRSLDKLTSALRLLPPNIEAKQVDTRDELSLKKIFSHIGAFDHLQITAGEMINGGFQETSTEKAQEMFGTKFWGSYNTAKYAVPFINDGGSVTFYSGRLGQRPASKGAALCSAVNSAIEGLARALAVELAPVRINALSPGLTKTEIFEKIPIQDREEFFKSASQSGVIKRPALPEEIASAAIYLMKSTYTTGSTLFIDGGYTFR